MLAGLGTMGAASAAAGAGTSALLSDAESFENNRLTAGELDLGVGYTARYSDWSADEGDGVTVRLYDGPTGTTGDAADLGPDETGLPTADAWLVAVDDPDRFLTNTETASVPAADGGDSPAISCADIPQADDVSRPVVDLDDVKPGDFGTLTLDFALCDNPGYVWLNGSLRDASEGETIEPEADDPDETDGLVELLDAVQAAVWVDDGDGYRDGDDVPAISGSLRTVLAQLGTSPGLALGGDADEGLGRNCFSHDGSGDGTVDVHHVSLAWWLPIDHGNEIQSDSVAFDLGLYTEQCRHNDGDGVDVEAVVSTPAVQQLLTDLGHPSPSTTGADGFGSMGPVPLDFDQARTRRVELTDPVDLGSGESTSNVYVTAVPSPFGTLQFTSTNTEPVAAPSFVFDADVPARVRDVVGVGDAVGWPEGTSAALLGSDVSSVFLRESSDEELSTAESAVGQPVDRAFAFDFGGYGLYAVPPAPDRPVASRTSSGPDDSRSLVTDGGTPECELLPDPLCDPIATGDTILLDPEFGVLVRYADEELAAQLSPAQRRCVNDWTDCVLSTLERGARITQSFFEICPRLLPAIQRWVVPTVVEESAPDPDRVAIPDDISGFFNIACGSIFAFVTGIATSLVIRTRCGRFSQCYTVGQSSEPTPSPAFETFTGGDADATVVSEDVSGGGELDLRIYRCSTARIAIGYGDLDATLSVSFDFEIRRTDAFGEDSYFRVYEDGDVVTETGRDLSIIQPTSEITGRVTKTVDVDGDVFLEFGIRPSDFCEFFDHEDTLFTASNLSVEIE